MTHLIALTDTFRGMLFALFSGQGHRLLKEGFTGKVTWNNNDLCATRFTLPFLYICKPGSLTWEQRARVKDWVRFAAALMAVPGSVIKNLLESAFGNFLTFMRQLEAAGTSAPAEASVMAPLDRAIKSLEQAQLIYTRLKDTAEQTPYDTAVIEKLRRFDYNGFLKSRELNPVVFTRVKKYLVKGEVRELYGHAAQEAARLLENVRVVKAKMEEGVNLPIEETWRANDSFMKFLAFGQYTAEVFKAVQQQ